MVQHDIMFYRGRRGGERMAVRFITSYAISRYEFESRLGEVYVIQHYVIKFVRGLKRVGGFLRVLLFPSPIKLTATI